MAGKKGMKHYPLATKLEAVRLDAEEGKSYQEIAAQLRIGDRKRVEKCGNTGQKGMLLLEEVQAARSGAVHPSGRTQKPISLGWRWRMIC